MRGPGVTGTSRHRSECSPCQHSPRTPWGLVGERVFFSLPKFTGRRNYLWKYFLDLAPFVSLVLLVLSIQALLGVVSLLCFSVVSCVIKRKLHTEGQAHPKGWGFSFCSVLFYVLRPWPFEQGEYFLPGLTIQRAHLLGCILVASRVATFSPLLQSPLSSTSYPGASRDLWDLWAAGLAPTSRNPALSAQLVPWELKTPISPDS